MGTQTFGLASFVLKYDDKRNYRMFEKDCQNQRYQKPQIMLTALFLFLFRKRLVPFINRYWLSLLFILAFSIYFIILLLMIGGYR